MQIQSIQNNTNQNINFGLKVAIKTQAMNDFMTCLNKHTNTTKKWEYNSKKDLELVTKIMEAFEKHPSQEEIIPDVLYCRGQFPNAKGVLVSSRAAFVDIETEGDCVSPIKNIFRRILHPDNRSTFNKLVGEEYSSQYADWWNENISPIWRDLTKNFRNKKLYSGNYEKSLNAKFREQDGNLENFIRK